MNTLARTAAAVTLALLASGAGARAETVAVVHAKLYAMDRATPLEDATLVIRDGKVAAAGPGVAAPAGARVIDAKGRVVTPGLMNAGSHLGLVEVTSVGDSADQAVTTGPLGAAFDVRRSLNANSTLLALARADGLTRAATYPQGSASAPFAGHAAVLRLTGGPDILDKPQAAMFAAVGGMASEGAGGSRGAQWLLIRNALTEARAFRATHADGKPRDQQLNRLDIEALQEVIAGRESLAVITSRESDIREAMSLADDFAVRVVIFGGAEAWRVAPELAARKIAVVLNPFDDLPWSFDEIGARLDNAAILNRAGVTIAFSIPGIHFSHNAGSAAREAAGLAVANGLPWVEGLKALTVNPAAIWRIGEHYGALTTGMDADLVIWDGDPLEPASAPALILVRGVEASLETRQRRLARRYAPAPSADRMPPAYR